MWHLRTWLWWTWQRWIVHDDLFWPQWFYDSVMKGVCTSLEGPNSNVQEKSSLQVTSLWPWMNAPNARHLSSWRRYSTFPYATAHSSGRLRLSNQQKDCVREVHCSMGHWFSFCLHPQGKVWTLQSCNTEQNQVSFQWQRQPMCTWISTTHQRETRSKTSENN